MYTQPITFTAHSLSILHGLLHAMTILNDITNERPNCKQAQMFHISDTSTTLKKFYKLINKWRSLCLYSPKIQKNSVGFGHYH